MKGFLIIFCVFLCFVFACNSPSTETSSLQLQHKFQLDARLPIDSNGFYHLNLNMNSWQTLHRISGSVDSVSEDWALTKVYWESSHYWIIGDTLGYIVHFNNPFNDTNYYYQTPDTTYITFFEGFEVPTINSASYSTMNGEINTMFAPVRNMLHDTITVSAQAIYADGYSSGILQIEIIID
ncbi:MAG: hypothetical protein VX347_04640 [Bacteroidota bacterium]|nr:hypothetical protein [Bacteroidota bacterium]